MVFFGYIFPDRFMGYGYFLGKILEITATLDILLVLSY